MTRANAIDAKAAFDELALLVLSDQTMDGLLHRIAELAQGVVEGASEVSVTLVAMDKATTVASTGPLALALDERQYECDAGPCLDAAQTGDVAHIPDMRQEARWPPFTTAAVEQGALSSLSTPIPMQQYARAALNMYGSTPDAFGPEAVALAGSFASYAGVALANMHLYESTKTLAEQLQSAMESRAVIEQAKGVLMGQRRCTADEAFDILVKLSQQSNRKLRDVAQALVDSASLE
ncbi:MAG: GAF and ANTAR domain-containing protein [Frankiaceae bacterium]|nr:GAF and ANTAR domain-containing protein [Frankiaceae bacterium]